MSGAEDWRVGGGGREEPYPPESLSDKIVPILTLNLAPVHNSANKSVSGWQKAWRTSSRRSKLQPQAAWSDSLMQCSIRPIWKCNLHHFAAGGLSQCTELIISRAKPRGNHLHPQDIEPAKP